MTELAFDDPCILFALRRESRAFLREFRPQQRFPGAPCWARFCGPSWLTVLVMETGIGPDAALRAIDWVLGRPKLENVAYRPKLVLSAGFCGGLQADLQIGDMILATEALDSDGDRWPATWPGELPGGDWRPPLRRGRVITTPQLVASAEDKAKLGGQQDGLAVDMESAVIGEICQRHAVPFGCVRAVSDRVDAPLSPRLASVLRGGRVSWARMAAALVRSPSMAGELVRLSRHTRLASEQLGRALGELLTLTLPFSEEL